MEGDGERCSLRQLSDRGSGEVKDSWQLRQPPCPVAAAITATATTAATAGVAASGCRRIVSQRCFVCTMLLRA